MAKVNCGVIVRNDFFVTQQFQNVAELPFLGDIRIRLTF